MRTVLPGPNVILVPAWLRAVRMKTARRACHAYPVVVVARLRASMVYVLIQDLTAAIATYVHGERVTAEMNAPRVPRVSTVYALSPTGYRSRQLCETGRQ